MSASIDTLAVSSREGGWLHRRAVDAVILGVPWLFLLVSIVRDAPGSYATWFAQFVWGNTTHVVLTFVLLATRRDVLRATPSQTRVVVLGSVATWAVTFALLCWVQAVAPTWLSFPMALVTVFGVQHWLAQARGIWSLYNLRAGRLGVPAPPPSERELQGNWVALGLGLTSTAWLFAPSGPERTFSLLQPIPLLEAPLPYESVYAMAGIWVAYSFHVIRTLASTAAPTRVVLPKLLHITGHTGAVTLAIVTPMWGGVVWGSIHGLEYLFLSTRMMQPREGDLEPGTPPAGVWPLALAAMVPLFLVGLTQSPFAIALTLRSLGPVDDWSPLLHAVNSLVVAHYFADAWIYRFRIPEVRRVALHRLGFAG